MSGGRRPELRVPGTRSGAVGDARPRFEYASVSSWAFALLRRRFAGVVLGTAAILLACYVVFGGLLGGLAVALGAADTADAETLSIVVYGLALPLYACANALLGGTLAAIAFAEYDGRPVGVWPALGRALRRLHVLALVHLLYLTACALGTVLLVAPGVLAGAYGWTAVPACVRERCSPGEGISRSVSLAQHNLGRAVGLAMTGVGLWFAAYMLGQCLSALVMIPFGLAIGGGGGGAAPIAMFATFVLVSLLALLLTHTVTCWAGLASAAYYAAGHGPHLGVDEDELDETFA